MIKTLRITSVAAVLLAVVVLASVLGYLRPASLLHLNFGVRSDKQIEKILSGPSAVERFKEQYGNKARGGEDTTPPLVKQAELFADIINPRLPDLPAGGVTTPLPPKPSFTKPAGPVSSKFELLGTCYSSNPNTSFAYIRLPDSTCKWTGVGTEIGHVTIKEIRNGSIVCWDGNKDVEMPTAATPETSSLLETGKAPNDASTPPQASSEPPTRSRISDVKLSASTAPVRAGRPFVASGRGTSLRVPPAQISKEEQENLTELGNRLKTSEGADSNTAVNKLISDFKSAQANPSQMESVPNPLTPVEDADKGNWKESMKEDTRRQWQRRLTMPRSMKK